MNTDEPQRTMYRAVKSSDFTQLSNAMLRDARLSYKARGILSSVLSNDDTWEVYHGWLEEKGTEGREAIRSGVQELESLGYVTYEEMRRAGQFQSRVWVWHETPVEESKRTNRTNWQPQDGKPSDGKPSDGNPSPKNTIRTEDHQTEYRAPAPGPKNEEPKKKTFSPPTLLQVTSHLQKLGYNGHAPSEAQAFIDHHETRGWLLSKGVKMKSWEAAVGTWKRNSEKFARPSGAAAFLPQNPQQVRMRM